MTEAFLHDLLYEVNVTSSDFTVVNPNFYERLQSGDDISLIFGEGYMNGEWTSDDLVGFIHKIFKITQFHEHLFLLLRKYPVISTKLIYSQIKQDISRQITDILQNNQSIVLSKQVGEQHYDIPDILYKHMLDTQRQYTCGYWTNGTNTLEEAQLNKINLIIDKMNIPDDIAMSVLDIGCGWGGLTNAISQRYPKCKVTGISISKEQINNASERYCKNPNLSYELCDYRDMTEQGLKFDRIVSVGMFEHVGLKNYNTFFSVCEQLLTPDGIFVLHTVTSPVANKYITGGIRTTTDTWLNKYIFPGSFVPTCEMILGSVHTKGMMCHHVQNLSISYAKTLREWHRNFVTHWKTIQQSNSEFFTPNFYRMWTLYLLGCMVSFEHKTLQLNQFVLTKNEFKYMYVIGGQNND